MIRYFLAPLAFALLASGVHAQTSPASNAVPAGGAKPAGVSKNPGSAPSGRYMLDPKHTSVIARIGHGGGTSLSTFRFGTSTGTLTWNGADPGQSQLAVTVDMTSLMTPVPDFASELIGDRFLKTGQFHDAKFQSTRLEQTGPTTGRITGNLTFMGQTRPVVIDATLVGVGANRAGPVIGFSGTTHFKRSDFGFSALTGPIGDDVELLLDVEFDKAA